MRSVCENLKNKSPKSSINPRTNKSNVMNILHNLSKDKTIYITRPDKSCGVIIMNRIDYINKMNTIINGPSNLKKSMVI